MLPPRIHFPPTPKHQHKIGFVHRCNAIEERLTALHLVEVRAYIPGGVFLR